MMCRSVKEIVEVGVMVVVMMLQLPHLTLTQECPPVYRDTQGCCPCQETLNTSSFLQCVTSCPVGYFSDVSSNVTCVFPTTTPTAITLAASTTQAAENLSSSTQLVTSTTQAETVNISMTTEPTSSPPLPLNCFPCYNHCKLCSGPEPNDCDQCETGFELKGNQSIKLCVPKPKDDESGSNIGLIVGVSVAGVVVVVAVVVVVVVVVCRRRKRSKESAAKTERFSGLKGSGSSPESGLESSVPSGGNMVSRQTKHDKPKPNKLGSLKDVTYENVNRTVPNKESIQQRHCDVTRYTPDPTKAGSKGQSLQLGTKPSLTGEEKELASLPQAPTPPGKNQPQPLADEYEITETPTPKPTSKPKPKPKPKPILPPDESYELVEVPKSPTKAKSQKVNRSKATSVIIGDRSGPVKAGDSSSLPGVYTAASSCPQLPLFPIEEAQAQEASKKQAVKSQQRLNKTPLKTHQEEAPDHDPEDYINLGKKKKEEQKKKSNTKDIAGKKKKQDEEEGNDKDYVNAAAKKKEKESEDLKDYENALAKKKQDEGQVLKDYENALAKKKQDEGQVLKDYENAGAKRKLLKPKKEEAQGIVNEAATLDEPQEMYGNQTVIEEHERTSRYSNSFHVPEQPSSDVSLSDKTHDDNDADDKKTNAEEAEDSEYVNVSPKLMKP